MEPTATPAPTLYLIDGYAAVFRAHHAIRRPLRSPVTGEPTGAVFGVARMLLKLYETLRPDYVAVALDAPGRTFRDDLFPAYKVGPRRDRAPAAVKGCDEGTGRAADPLGAQMPRVRELLRLLGVPIVCRPGLEADDLIATLTDRALADASRPDLRVRIVSPDKDLEQLIGDRVTLYDVHTGAETDAAALCEKRGVTPAQVVDLLALTGDPTDNIPGVAGIGPKTAARLLQQFGTLDALLADVGRITGAARAGLESASDRLTLSRRLLTLRRDPDLPFALEDARARPLPGAALGRLFKELGFASLQARLTLCSTG